MSINGKVKSGTGVPNCGYGQGPVYLSGQITWYSAGSQGLVIITDGSYSGPILGANEAAGRFGLLRHHR